MIYKYKVPHNRHKSKKNADKKEKNRYLHHKGNATCMNNCKPIKQKNA